MSLMKIKFKRVFLGKKNEYTEIFVDGKTCGKIADYGDEYSATVMDVIQRMIDKLGIEVEYSLE